MFSKIVTWFRRILGSAPPMLVIKELRLDEFHKTTYPKLFAEAWNMVAGKPPHEFSHDSKDLSVSRDYRNYISSLQLSGSKRWRGARIEFNDKGEGRVIPVNNNGEIEIKVPNLPVRSIPDIQKTHRLNQKDSKEFWAVVRRCDGGIGIEKLENPDPRKILIKQIRAIEECGSSPQPEVNGKSITGNY